MRSASRVRRVAALSLTSVSRPLTSVSFFFHPQSRNGAILGGAGCPGASSPRSCSSSSGTCCIKKTAPEAQEKSNRRAKEGGGSFARWKSDAERPPPEANNPIAALPEELPPSPPRVRQRSDSGWRDTRAVKARDQKIAKLEVAVNDLEEKVAAASSSARSSNAKAKAAERKVKDIKHQKYVEAKTQREMMLKAESRHKVELKKQQDEHIEAESRHKAELKKQQDEHLAALDSAYREQQMETRKALAAESARFLAVKNCKAEKEKGLLKLTKERSGQAAVVRHMRSRLKKKDQQWQAKLTVAIDEATAQKDKEITEVVKKKDHELMQDRVKNQEQ